MHWWNNLCWHSFERNCMSKETVNRKILCTDVNWNHKSIWSRSPYRDKGSDLELWQYLYWFCIEKSTTGRPKTGWWSKHAHTYACGMSTQPINDEMVGVISVSQPKPIWLCPGSYSPRICPFVFFWLWWIVVTALPYGSYVLAMCAELRLFSSITTTQFLQSYATDMSLE